MINEHQQTNINNQEENQKLYNIDFPTINTIKQNSCQISQLSEEIGCQNKGCCDIELSTDIEFSCDLFNDNLKSLSKTQSIDFIQENNQEVFNRNDQNNDQIQEEEDEDYFDDEEEEEEDEIEEDENSQEQQYQQQNQTQQTQIQIENKQQQQQQIQNSNVFQFNNEQIQKQIQQQQQLEQENGIFSSESETSSESSSEEEDAEEDDASSEEIEDEEEDNYEDEFDQDTLRNTIRNAKKTYNQRDLNICLGQICDSLKNCEGFKQFIELNIDINIQSISEKCQNEIYKNQEEFKGDFEKMFEILYFNNTRNSSIYQETMKMQRKFIQLYSQFDAKYVQVQIQRLNQTSNFFIEQEEQKTNLPFNEGCEIKNQNQNQKNQNNNQNTVSFDLAVKKVIQKPKRGVSLNVQKTKNNININNKQKKVAGSKKSVIWSFAKIKQINYCVDECLQQGVVGHSFADLKQPHFYGPNQIQQQQEYFEEIEKQQSGFCSSNEFDVEEDSEEDEEDTFDRFQKGGKINKKSYKQSQQLKSCLKKQLQMKNIRNGKKPYCNNMIVIKQGPLIESEFEDDELTTDQI